MSDVQGECAPEFSAVRDAFAENFESREELGASVCVYAEGRKVVDLWGGFEDAGRTAPWRKETIVNMMSVFKGVIALCVHMLAERGKLRLDEPVATYWPEFAQGGKAAITVKQLMSHQAGLIYPDHAPEGSYFDWDVMISALERQTPEWPPGSRGAYHSSTYVFLGGCAAGFATCVL